jgi:hypothetical protein
LFFFKSNKETIKEFNFFVQTKENYLLSSTECLYYISFCSLHQFGNLFFKQNNLKFKANQKKNPNSQIYNTPLNILIFCVHVFIGALRQLLSLHTYYTLYTVNIVYWDYINSGHLFKKNRKLKLLNK